ncbi:hypothetical protein PR202_ga10489 [Eleusine coracana subsp. coracana]|uniref:Uncharacterized protein n=1 Tax=Eleusine coracana subsp. coracana TaxID=191504 RepID=A0AAV5C6T3_ELECO|nr:hypothetical protein PR202_ga10489 [Eleusine coracana subsp. coracana]
MAEPNHSSIVYMPAEQAKATRPQPLPDEWVTAEKCLNYFVGALALMERVGNCLGTLAFTWATVVVLGGFSTNLGVDFWYATAIVFLEAFRVFSRESRSDDELLFRTTGSIKLKRMKLLRGISYYLTVSIVIAPMPAGYLNDNAWLQFITALVAVLALGSAMLWSHAPKREILLIIPPLFVGCFQSLVPVAVARIVISVERLYIKDNGRNAGNEHLASALTIFYSMVLAQGVLYLAACVLESLLSFYFRRSLAWSCNLLTSKTAYESINLYYEHAYNKRMKEGVLAQEDMDLVTFAFDSLDSNSNDKKLAAVQILDSLLVLEQKNTSKSRLVPKIINSTKVVASLINMLGWTPDSEDKEKGIDGNEYALTRLLAAKVIASLAKHLRIVGIPGTVQMVSSLLDADVNNKKQKQDVSKKILYRNEVDINDNQQQSHASSTLVTIQGERSYHAPRNGQKKLSKQMEEGNKSEIRYVKIKFFDRIGNMLHDLNVWKPSEDMDLFPTLGMLILERLAHDLDNCVEIIKAPGLIRKIIEFIINTTDTTNNIMISSLKLIAKLASTEGEMGMTIRKKILCQDLFLSNLVEILIDNDNHSEQWKLVMVVITKIILADGTDNDDNKIVLTDEKDKNDNKIIVLADGKENNDNKIVLADGKDNDIDKFSVIIPELMLAFLGPHESSNTDYDHSLRLLAGEVLSKMTEKNDPSIFMAILQEKGYSLIRDLKNMLQQDEYICVAASLLINLCAHSQDKLHHHLRPNEELSSILKVVLEKILDAKGKQLQVLIVTTSKLYNLIPKKYFACELESCTNKETFVEKLVDALNSNKKMCHECPTMRRVIVDITISITESCPLYSPIFESKGMIEALSNVERILTNVEKYKVFLGQLGDNSVLNWGLPPPDLVTKAKKLIGSPNEEPNVHDLSSTDIDHVN